jgi:hypothetical protein
MYAQGIGVAQDDVQAVSWYRKAAEQGYAKAQFALGLMYEDGKGVAQDDVQAVSWYRKAAEQGDAMAQFALGLMYEQGQGVAQDDVQAHMWFNIASANGDADARKMRDMVANLMPPKQREQAQKLASDWMRQHRN